MITNNIAPMRQAWINEVREKISELLSLYGYTCGLIHGDDDITLFDNDKDKNNEIVVNLKRIILLTNQLKLLLPKNESEYSELIQMLDKIIDNVFDFKLSENESTALNDSVIEKTRILLKKEWEVTKSLKEIE